MCLVCVEYNKGRMTIKVAQRAAQELYVYGQDDEEALHILEMTLKFAKGDEDE